MTEFSAEFDCFVELVSDDHGNPLIWDVEEGGVARFENDDALIFEHDLDVFLGEWAVGRRDACDLTFSEWAACFEVLDRIIPRVVIQITIDGTNLCFLPFFCCIHLILNIFKFLFIKFSAESYKKYA